MSLRYQNGWSADPRIQREVIEGQSAKLRRGEGSCLKGRFQAAQQRQGRKTELPKGTQETKSTQQRQGKGLLKRRR